MQIGTEAVFRNKLVRMVSVTMLGFIVAAGSASQGLSQSSSVSVSMYDLSDKEKEHLVLQPSTIWTIKVDKAYESIVIGDLGVLDAFPLTDTSLYIQTKKTGITNLVLFDDDKAFLGEVVVQVAIDNPEPKLQALINDAVPDANVAVSMINNRVYLKGFIKKREDIDVIIKIAESFRASKEPVIYSFEYPTVSEPTRIGVLNRGQRTVFLTPASANGRTTTTVTSYGTTAIQSEETDVAENSQPVVININSGEEAKE
ncbi:pilus assembly protein N-terminal domain-containing protein [Alisedimentitalea sp. MJ-SS2]|uniref:pilus assembly protein N-terminal domain-containing protein n=1 Tax=Aliisedimentitalea sp. MJ-SS2 TaxID=3049795 RepID=UPI0029137146|nr:pilus assembly protein N-terminal domain-containing protein [Alisedimentitalea sp. MJ-SS2]MDU8928295.1 pilus assembly protein N-terminal domain-containing protein [Alisedimentitalea sp. MJ-SS2]